MKDTRIHSGEITLAQLIALRVYSKAFYSHPWRKSVNLLNGVSHSSLRGRGMDFEEVRLYQPGDDIRTIDWRVTGKMNKPYTKIYREEKERQVYVIVDLRSAMHFGSRVTLKSVIAQQIAAILIWASEHRGDSIGSIILSDNKVIQIKPWRGSQNVLHILKQLNQVGTTDQNPSRPSPQLKSVLKNILNTLKPGSFIFILSDFYEWDEEIKKYLAGINTYNDTTLIFIYDILETLLPQGGIYPVTNGNAVVHMNCFDDKLRQQYAQQFQEKFAELKQTCLRHRLGWIPMKTEEDVVAKLRYCMNK